MSFILRYNLITTVMCNNVFHLIIYFHEYYQLSTQIKKTNNLILLSQFIIFLSSLKYLFSGVEMWG